MKVLARVTSVTFSASVTVGMSDPGHETVVPVDAVGNLIVYAEQVLEVVGEVVGKHGRDRRFVAELQIHAHRPVPVQARSEGRISTGTVVV